MSGPENRALKSKAASSLPYI